MILMQARVTTLRINWVDGVRPRKLVPYSYGLHSVRFHSCLKSLRGVLMDFVGAWAGSIVVAFISWRRGKSNRPRDPPFHHPTDASGYAPSLRHAEAGEYEEDDDGDEDEEPFSYPGDRRQPVAASSHLPPSSNIGYGGGGLGSGNAPQIPPFRANSKGGFGVDNPSPFGDEYRASGTAGGGVGGFTSPPPPAAIAPPPQNMNTNTNTNTGGGGPGVSRTMQFADPYAAIKANLAGGTSPGRGGNDYTGYR